METVSCKACGCETPAGEKCDICGSSLALQLEVCLLIYDIPERSGLGNPSGFLRSRAARINLSAWLIRPGDVPYSLLADLKAGGATWHVAKFDAGEGVKLAALAIESMKKEAREALKRARKAQGAAAKRIEKKADDAAAVESFQLRGREAVSRLRRLLKDLEAAAERLGLGAKSLSLDASRTAVEAISAKYAERARLYSEAAGAAERTATPTGKALGRAARGDAVPAGILADYLDESGEDGSKLRGAFGE